MVRINIVPINKEILKLTSIPDIDLSDLNVTYGVYVYSSFKDEYGLHSGDVIVGMNDIDIYNDGMLEANLRNYKGSSITWKVIRNNELQSIVYNFD